MLPQELDDWLTAEGLRTAGNAASSDPPLLDDREQLLNEFSLFDTEQRNSRIVSQYFCNWGLARWQLLSRLATSHLPSFARFAREVRRYGLGDSAILTRLSSSRKPISMPGTRSTRPS